MDGFVSRHRRWIRTRLLATETDYNAATPAHGNAAAAGAVIVTGVLERIRTAGQDMHPCVRHMDPTSPVSLVENDDRLVPVNDVGRQFRRDVRPHIPGGMHGASQNVQRLPGL
jgi:hypothetical protein